MIDYAKAIAIGVATTLIAMYIWSKFVAPKMNSTKAATE